MHKIIAGPADQSYGIHVAKLAGLPEEVINQANEMLLEFENQDDHQNIQINDNQLDLFTPEAVVDKTQTDVLTNVDSDIIDEIKSISLMNKTPFELMNLINDWQQRLIKD